MTGHENMEPVVFKDYAAIIVACLAAVVSIASLVWSVRLNESRERKNILWERELGRFFELEDMAGCLVEDLLNYNIRDEERSEALTRLQTLRAFTGRFRRYPAISSALRELTHSSGWFISQDMRHET